MMDCLQLFDKQTAEWFLDRLGNPTPVQEASWPAIAAGGHVLVSAPTGTGKTLSAFLVFLDRLKRQAAEGDLKRELQLIYVSPLKSLAADIRENLRKPLEGIEGEEMVSVAIRTGDTTQRERQQMIRKPPHILIITPESLYLMLTSRTGQNVLCTAKAVIIDELHALIDTKRGAHLMLSLARLDGLCKRNLQRIGLSATIAPLDRAAAYLAPEAVTVAAPSMEKKVKLQILGPYADTGRRRKDPVWQELAALVYQYCQGNRSVIAFVEGRRYAEKLAYYVNLLGGEDFARVHHGSLSKEQRQETEESLREGRLRLLCATSSMELGIDVGEIDQVLQVGCPRTISGTMQRLGRAGHNPSRTSVMYLFPRTAAECVLCGMTAQLAREGRVERVNPPEGCLDVLAQHLVSMAAFKSYEIDEVMELLPRAWPFRNVTKEDVKRVLEMLAGDYEHRKDVPVRPRILYDRIHERVEGDGYSRMLAISAGGTIPDKGLFTVRTEAGVKIGEVDEEFVYETRKGDRFLLGAFAWKVTDIGRDTVTVTQAPVEGARLPFWKGELKGRSRETGAAFGRILRGLGEAEQDGRLEEALGELGLDGSAASLSAGYLSRQIRATGGLPDDRTIIAEHFRDRSGNSQLMIHSVFGRQINSPLALLAAQAAKGALGINVGSVDEEDGFLLYAYGNERMPERLLHRIGVETAEEILSAMLPATPLFNMAFRYNCGRALMMGVRGNGRQPLWMQRLRSAEMLEQVVLEREHPLIRETRQECMNQLWDVAGVREILERIHTGEILVREVYTETASPMSLPLQWAQEAAVMYDYAPTPRGIHVAVEEALKGEKELVRPGEAELAHVQERRKLPEDEKQLHSLLMTEGDLAAGELDIPVEWLEKLAEEGRAVYLEQGLWIAAEQQEEYGLALGQNEAALSASAQPENAASAHIVRRMLRYRGGAGASNVAHRYGWETEKARGILEDLCRKGEVVRQGEAEAIYYHAQLYKRARVQTLKNRREEIATCPPENYVSLLLSRIQRQAPPEESLREAVDSLTGLVFPAAIWEEVILPMRVRNYRESLLDSLLVGGEYFWHMEEGGRLRFDAMQDIDWGREPEISWETLTEPEKLLAETLSRRGASFMQALKGVLPEGGSNVPPLYDVLQSLLEKGVVCADSFVPVRQWLNKEKTRKAPARQRVNVRVKALQAGRFDLVRPLRALTVQEQMDRCFDRYLILCRETAAACELSWQEALNILRVQEYTGQVRRGYFVKGLSGAQFIRREDFESVTHSLLHPVPGLADVAFTSENRTARRYPDQGIIWLNAADPVQPWGKLFPHAEGKAFVNVPGTAVALAGGIPAALFERQGKTFRIFAKDGLEDILRQFTEEFKRGRIFADRKRIVVKEYPEEAAEAFGKSGFLREMQDYCLYR
ncbi:MAG: DEAD/DEAH box helicase [Lachnospiraceae bacterium]|nr:DEAD/DEAH box helicase [Lachnospiraceae bacterium]MCM1240183.1 DEAD/DEAH box helicase [Lachnospiraceae bacterium]